MGTEGHCDWDKTEEKEMKTARLGWLYLLPTSKIFRGMDD